MAVGEVREDGLVSLDNTSCTGMCDQGPAGLVNGYALTRLDRPRIDQITDLINQQKPLDEWPGELFQVDDNIIKPGLLLSQSIDQGAALKQRLNEVLQETLAEIDKSGLRGRGGAGFKTATEMDSFAPEELKISVMSFVMPMKANPARLKTECC